MAKLAHYHNLFPALREFVSMGKAVWGTCAGLIFLANKAVGQKEGGQDLWVALIVRCTGTSSVVSYKALKHVFQCHNSHQRKEAQKHSAEFLYALLLSLKQVQKSKY